MAAFAAGSGRRARRDDRDRGRDRRAQRDRDADRERRALRDLPAAPAARARRARRAPLALPARRAADAAARRGCGALARHADGFRLAEIDLALRKEGELIGTRQSGLGQFRVARLPEDAQLLELRARPRRGDHRRRPGAARARARAARRGARARSSAARRSSRSPPEARSTAACSVTVLGMRVIAGAPRRQAPAGAGGQGHAADLRPRPRGGVRDARRRRGARVLDLFAGTGALGIEALSRGAAQRRVRRARRRRGAGPERRTSRRSASPRRRAEVRRGDALEALRGAASAKRHTIWSSSTLPTGGRDQHRRRRATDRRAVGSRAVGDPAGAAEPGRARRRRERPASAARARACALERQQALRRHFDHNPPPPMTPPRKIDSRLPGLI